MRIDFKSAYITAAQNLFGSLPENLRIKEDDLVAAAKKLRLAIPKSLYDYYIALGNFEKLNKAHNQLLSPSEWFIDADHLVFMEENQCVVFWGVPIEKNKSDDTSVHIGVNSEENPIEWHLEHNSCFDFLLVMMHWQAVCGGFDWVGFAETEKTDIKYFQSNWKNIGQVSGLKTFSRTERAACLLEEGDAVQAYVGANTENAFDEMVSEFRLAGIELEEI